MAGPRLLRFMNPQLRFFALTGPGAVAATGAVTGVTLGGALSNRGASPIFRVVCLGVLSIGER